MSETSTVIENISDTALWVAFYRAMETERPDAHFKDPFARTLAGARGEEMVRKIPGAQRNAWAMIVRTCLFDEIILRLINEKGVDTVLNLAAGLDTRPYRLSLPASLSWFEIDFPAILNYKEAKLQDQKPVCRLERIKMDLSDVAARKEVFARIGVPGKQTLLLTEGLLVYLTRDQVISLANDLHAQPSFRWWMLDFVTPRLLKMLLRTWDKTLAAGNSRMQFAPEEGLDFYRSLGWKVAEFRSTWLEARRLNRRMALSWLWDGLSRLRSEKTRQEYLNMSANVLLERA
jgi:methyltransferase (TIGR00027 family)